jgi:hypothetical protein
MASGGDLNRYTEKQIQNIKAPYRTKGLASAITVAGTEVECTFENSCPGFEIYSAIDLWISFVANGTAGAGSQRMFVKSGMWNDFPQAEFLEKVYIVNFTAAQTGAVHFKYRD